MNRHEHDRALRNLVEMPAPALGIDLDGCVDEAPIFFQVLTSRWPGMVVVLSYRDDHEKAAQFLDQYRIRWDEIVLVQSFDEKAKVIAEKGILVYFDDQPEMLKDIPSTVSAKLVRNGGNYDFDSRKWLFSKHAGRLV